MEIIKEIDNLTEYTINDVAEAVLCKYKQLFPAWEIAIFSSHKQEDRNAQIDSIIGLLENLKTSP